jgi:hypothetical protein
MKRIIFTLFWSSIAVVLTGCAYNQGGCMSGCGFVETTTATSVVKPTYVTTTTRTKNCCGANYVVKRTTTCCSMPTCNRCGGGGYGYYDSAFYGPDYGYDSYSYSQGWY